MRLFAPPVFTQPCKYTKIHNMKNLFVQISLEMVSNVKTSLPNFRFFLNLENLRMSLSSKSIDRLTSTFHISNDILSTISVLAPQLSNTNFRYNQAQQGSGE